MSGRNKLLLTCTRARKGEPVTRRRPGPPTPTHAASPHCPEAAGREAGQTRRRGQQRPRARDAESGHHCLPDSSHRELTRCVTRPGLAPDPDAGRRPRARGELKRAAPALRVRQGGRTAASVPAPQRTSPRRPPEREPRAPTPSAGPRSRAPPALVGTGVGKGVRWPGRSTHYLRMLCASMLRFWLLEHTTATRSGDDGMAKAAPSAEPAPGLPPSRGLPREQDGGDRKSTMPTSRVRTPPLGPAPRAPVSL